MTNIKLTDIYQSLHEEYFKLQLTTSTLERIEWIETSISMEKRRKDYPFAANLSYSNLLKIRQ